MNVVDILDTAKQTLVERGKSYDKKGEERSFNHIAKVFNALTQDEFNLKGSDVALLLLCLKLVRQQTAPEVHVDSIIDGTAFAAFYGECLTLEQVDNLSKKIKAAEFSTESGVKIKLLNDSSDPIGR